MPGVLTLGYSPYGNYDSIIPFDKLFSAKQNIASEGFAGVDAVILWGGEDWHPSFYHQKHHPTNGADKAGVSARDVFEWKAMLFCKANNIPLIGVCRGAQGLCIGAGGKLVQHVTSHGFDHNVTTKDKSTVWVTSTHHQMMWPWDVKHELLAWTDQPRSNIYEAEVRGQNIPGSLEKQEAEIVYFPQLKGLAIQGHPEYSSATQPFISLCLDYVKEYILK